jgi:uncharacterized membrane protein
MNENGRPARLPSLDTLRGLVMSLMVLDHARDFFFGLTPRPTDLATTTVPLFLTRWITHFCAPVFVFLAGTSARLYARRHGAAAASRFLLVRGLGLVALELTVVRLGWIPDLGYHFTVVQVIWALGWSMVALAGLGRLPAPALAAVGAVVVAGHDLLDGVRASALGPAAPLWIVLHQPGFLEPVPGHRFFVSYSLIPWVGVMALGHVFGGLYGRPADERRRLMNRIGLAAAAAFVVLRLANRYGDPTPWAPQPRGPIFTVLSFINCEKYPPSLLFLLMTLGPALCLLARLEGGPAPRALRPLATFGRVPLLFYVAHLFLLRYASGPLAYARWGASAFLPPPGHAGSPGFPLWTAYLAWALALLVLAPLCRRLAWLKQHRPAAWLSYL